MRDFEQLKPCPFCGGKVELEQQLEEAQKDAERYRYLRDKSVQLFEIRHWVGYWDNYYGHRLDTVVDAAISKIGGGE